MHLSPGRMRLLVATAVFLLAVGSLLGWISRPPSGSQVADIVGPEARVGESVFVSGEIRSQPATDVVMIELETGDLVRVKYASTAPQVRFQNGSHARFYGTLTASRRVEDASPVLIGSSKYWSSRAQRVQAP